MIFFLFFVKFINLLKIKFFFCILNYLIRNLQEICEIPNPNTQKNENPNPDQIFWFFGCKCLVIYINWKNTLGKPLSTSFRETFAKDHLGLSKYIPSPNSHSSFEKRLVLRAHYQPIDGILVIDLSSS